MKKFLMVLLIVTMVLGTSVIAFAEESVDTVENERTVSKEKAEARIVGLFETYFPSGLESYLGLKEVHQMFHENSKSEREAIREANKAEIEDLRSQVKSGEITRDEVKVVIESKKAEIQILKEAITPILESKKVDAELIKNEVKAIRENLKTVLTADEVDSSAVVELLDALLLQMDAHLDMDYYYYELIQDLL